MDDLRRMQAEIIALQVIVAHMFGTLARQRSEPSNWLHEEEARLQARLDQIITLKRPDPEDLEWAKACHALLDQTMHLARSVSSDRI